MSVGKRAVRRAERLFEVLEAAYVLRWSFVFYVRANRYYPERFKKGVKPDKPADFSESLDKIKKRSENSRHFKKDSHLIFKINAVSAS